MSGTVAGLLRNVLWSVVGMACALATMMGVPGVVGQRAGSLPPFDFHHRAVMDHRGAYVMLWTPLQDQIIIEVQVRWEPSSIRAGAAGETGPR